MYTDVQLIKTRMDVLLCLSLYFDLNTVCFKTVKTKGAVCARIIMLCFLLDCSWHSSNNEYNTANSIVRDCCSHLQYTIHCLKGDFEINFKTSQSWHFCKIWKSSDYKIYNWLVFLLNAHYLKTKF